MLEMIEPYADYMLAVCHVFICLGIIPIIWVGRTDQRVPYITSFTFIGIPSLLGLALLSQGLVFGAVTDFMGAVLWGVVAGERLVQRKAARS